MSSKAYKQSFAQNDPVVSEKSWFLFSHVHVNDPRLRSRNDIDLQCSHTFINTISCQHVTPFRSQTVILSEKSGPLVPEKKIFKVFSINGHDGHLGHVTWIIYTNLCSPFPMRLHMKFGFDWPNGCLKLLTTPTTITTDLGPQLYYVLTVGVHEYKSFVSFLL